MKISLLVKYIALASIFIFSKPYLLLASEVNDFPPYNAPPTVEYYDNIFKELNKHTYFQKFDPSNPEAGRYGYNFSLGWPQLENVVQAGILWDRQRLYLTWWTSERRDTRIIAAALILTLDRVDIDMFNPPVPDRFNKIEKQLRYEENKFVIENLEYFYNQFYEIFNNTLPQDHKLVKILENRYNLKTQYIQLKQSLTSH